MKDKFVNLICCFDYQTNVSGLYTVSNMNLLNTYNNTLNNLLLKQSMRTTTSSRLDLLLQAIKYEYHFNPTFHFRLKAA